MRIVRRSIGAAAALLLLSGTAVAQERPRPRETPRGLVEVDEGNRHGFWGSLGFGAGGEVFAWIDDHGDRTESLSNVLFIGQIYPAASTGLYLKGGLGIARNEVDFDEGFGVGDTGFAGSLGAGWEVRVGRSWYINPTVDVVEQRYTGRGGDRYRERIVNFGVSVLFQAGR